MIVGKDIVISSAPSGVGFMLNDKAKIDAHEVLAGGWTAEVFSEAQTIIASGSGVSGYEETRDTGLEVAQQALDFFCIRGRLNLSIIQVETHHFVWWTEGSKRIMRIVGVSDLHIGTSISVVDAHGNPITPLTPTVVWHPSFRYFRVAQVSTDLLDAYRNLYLALESILTTIIPMNTHERESAWLKRALQQVNTTLPLATYAPPGSTNPPDDIYIDIYANTRTAIFHAKQGRNTVLPQRLSTRAGVVETLSRLSNLYLALVYSALGMQRASGVITYGGFDAIMQQWINANSAIAISDDDAPLNLDDTLINPHGGITAHFAAAHDPTLDRLGNKYWLGEAPFGNLKGLQCIRRLGLLNNSNLALAERLDDPVGLSGVDVLQVQLGVRLVNVNIPRATFKT